MERPEKYLIRKISILTGKMNEMEIELTPSQFKAILSWQRGEEARHIQNILPNHTPEVREFLMNGLSLEEQDRVFRGEENDDYRRLTNG